MAGFSVGVALGEAFGLIRRRPVSVVVWGAVCIVPMIGAFALILPEMGRLVAATSRMSPGPGAGPSEAMMAQMAQFQGVFWLAYLVQILGLVVAYTAAMRAVLRPADRSFFSLRLSMDEVRVGVIGFAIFVGMYVAMIIAVVVAALIGVAAYFAGRFVFAPVLVILILAVLGGYLFGLARLSLIAPTSVLRRDFAFDEGWSLGRGVAWRLFGLLLAVVGIMLLIEVIVMIVWVGVFATSVLQTGGHGMGEPGLGRGGPMVATDNPFPAMQAWSVAHWPLLAAGVVVACVFYGLVLVMIIVPFASACRQLTQGKPAPT